VRSLDRAKILLFVFTEGLSYPQNFVKNGQKKTRKAKMLYGLTFASNQSHEKCVAVREGFEPPQGG
jgi:hypothetical protein